MSQTFSLSELGWNSFFADQLEKGTDPRSFGRVAEEHKGMYRVYTERGTIWAEVKGKLMHASRLGDYPAVGDWVEIRERAGEDRSVIERVLARFSKFSRAIAGKHIDEQVVATNIDIAFLVTSLNQDLNLRRIERYLTGVWASGAAPVILLSKADLCSDVEDRVAEVRAVSPGVDVRPIATLRAQGIDEVMRYLGPGKTGVLLGSSGVGKSTLFNRLAGSEEQETGEVRSEDDRGRHVTRYRRLYLLPGAGMLIDTPGMRELMVWQGERGVEQAFSDIFEHMTQCRFSDCSHRSEPGCGVLAALKSGALGSARFQNYLKLVDESQTTSKPKRGDRPGARHRRQ